MEKQEIKEEQEIRVKLPRPVQDRDAAIKAYYGNGYIGSKEIRTIFGLKSDSAVCRVKNTVRDAELKLGIPVGIIRGCVSVKAAFKVWGLDIKELERNRQRLKTLGLDAVGQSEE